MDDHIKGYRRSEDEQWTWQPAGRRPGIKSWLQSLAAKFPRLTRRIALPAMPPLPPWLRAPGVPSLPRLPTPAGLLRRLRGIRWPGLPELPAQRAPALPRLRLPRLPRPHVRREMLAVVATFLAASVLVAGAVLVARAGGGDEKAIVLPGPTTPTETAATMATATATATTSPAPTPAPTPFPENQLGVAWWSKSNTWVFGDLSQTLSGYRQGEAVPFLARWGAGAGQTFRVTLIYDCATAAGAALDFIAGGQAADGLPAMTAPGPGRQRPDAAIPPPDDPSITTDDGDHGLLELWGGKFLRLAEGPAPAAACAGQKSIGVDVLAAGGTVYLLASAHLAPGAAAQVAPYGLQVAVTGIGAQKVNLAPDAVTP